MIQIDYKDLYEFIRDLKCESESEASDDHIKLAYWYTRSDGCTGTVDLLKSACIIHDFHYRTHHDLCGKLINRAEADRRFRIRMHEIIRDAVMDNIPLTLRKFIVITALAYVIGYCAPLPWWRWLLVRTFGQRFWDDKTNCRV